MVSAMPRRIHLTITPEQEEMLADIQTHAGGVSKAAAIRHAIAATANKIRAEQATMRRRDNLEEVAS